MEGVRAERRDDIGASECLEGLVSSMASGGSLSGSRIAPNLPAIAVEDCFSIFLVNVNDNGTHVGELNVWMNI